MNTGDIVLIPFPCTNLSDAKNKPSPILAKGENDRIISFITTQLKWQEANLRNDSFRGDGLKRSFPIRHHKLAAKDRHWLWSGPVH